jgi:hypothetical protein
MANQGSAIHDEEVLYPKLQWVIDTLYQNGQGPLKYLESCMLEAVKNAVKRFAMMGVLQINAVQIRRNVFKNKITVAPEYLKQGAIKTLYDSIARFTTSNIQDFGQVSNTIKDLTVTGLMVGKL